MNALPSIIVLDFYEWLKNRSQQRHSENCTDLYDLILNDEYGSSLKQLAQEYLKYGRYSFRALLHCFIDSEEFAECERRCHPFLLEELDHSYQISPDDIYMFLHHCCYSIHADRAFENFITRYYRQGLNDFQHRERITPEMLADSVKFYVEHMPEEPFVMEFMSSLNTDLSLEIDFLEWLMLNKAKPMNLSKMPTSLFESIVDEYCSDVHRNQYDKNKLVKAFKKGDAVSLGKKLVSVLTRTQANKMKSLGYIFERYTSEKIPFRCFFLPLASEADAFKKFIKNNWIDLNSMSGDYLDIFYGEEDFGKSGFAIKDDMRMAPKNIPGKLPCLIIWQDSLQHAQTIDIEGLSDKEIVRLIATIVDLIKGNKPFDTITMEAKEIVKEINQAHVDALRPTTYNTFNIENNTGIATGYISDSTVTVYSGIITDNKFEKEAEKAIGIINSFTEVEKEHRDALISLVKKANIAIQNNDDSAKLSCKSKYEGFMLGAGKYVGMIITKLSELATIAAFFGLSA